jgi:hypothetical protein
MGLSGSYNNSGENRTAPPANRHSTVQTSSSQTIINQGNALFPRIASQTYEQMSYDKRPASFSANLSRDYQTPTKDFNPALFSATPSRDYQTPIKEFNPGSFSDTPSRDYQTPIKEFKIFHFFYNDTQKDLKVYTGTPVELVWRTLFQQLGIPHSPQATLASLIDSISIVDCDDCTVVFSPEHIPHGVKLYVHCTVSCPTPTTMTTTAATTNLKSVTKEQSNSSENSNSEGSKQSESSREVSEDMEFSWDAKWNSLYCGYTLQDNDRTLSSGNTLVSRSSSMPILISNRAFKKGTGVYKWRVVFKEEMKHHAVGLVWEEEISFPRKCASFGNHFPSVPWFYKTSQMGVKNTVIILDTNKSKAIINGKEIEGIPDSVYAAVCFKMPLNMEAQLLFDVE